MTASRIGRCVRLATVAAGVATTLAAAVSPAVAQDISINLGQGSGLTERVIQLIAFITVGALPLLVFVYDLAAPGNVENAFAWSAVMTGIAFFVVGALKSRFVDQAWWRSGVETLVVGGIAAALAYAVGALLQNIG